jgi:hypothetical protein
VFILITWTICSILGLIGLFFLLNLVWSFFQYLIIRPKNKNQISNVESAHVHPIPTLVTTEIEAAEILNPSLKIMHSGKLYLRDTIHMELDNSQSELLRAELLEALSLWKSELNLISEDLEGRIRAMLDSIEDGDTKKLLQIFSECKTRNLDPEHSIDLLKGFLDHQLSQHLDVLKNQLLSDLTIWTRQGLISDEESASVHRMIIQAELSELFLILCFYESAVDLKLSAKDIADEIKSLL